MTTKISKIMVVFVTTASIAFLGIAIGLRNLGPNWLEETQNLKDYSFTRSEGENPQWTATRRSGSQPPTTSASLANVIAKSYDAETRLNQEKVTEVSPQIQQLKDRITQLAALIEEDGKGIKQREEQLALELQNIGKQIQALSTDGERLATQAVDIRADAERTRESGMRLNRQRIQIETDQYRLTQQKRHLLDLVYQMDGVLQRLREREQQLIKQGAVATQPAAPAGNSST